MNEALVAAAILAAGEGGILPSGLVMIREEAMEIANRVALRSVSRRAGSPALRQAGMPAATTL